MHEENKVVPFLQGGLVLLIDDEDIIRELGIDIINMIGMQCITAATGELGVEVYKENKDDIRLVVLDIELPGICGNEVYESLIRINPNVKVLLVSGYDKGYIEQRFFKKKISNFMRKPFGVTQMAQMINNLFLGHQKLATS